MRYDKDTDTLYVSVSEAVTAARLGLSPYHPSDEDEPMVCIGEVNATSKLYREQIFCGHKLSIFGSADLSYNGELHAVFSVPSARELKRVEAKKQIRGEMFMLASLCLHSRDDEKLKLVAHVFQNESKDEEIIEETATRSKIFEFYGKCLEVLPAAIAPEIERVTARLPSMATAKFPYGKARIGQAEFIKTAYRSIAKGSILYATAPTGTGKTVSALFPAIRAIGNAKVDKAFYLTPKETTAAAAKECLELFAKSEVKIRAIILIAKDKLCKRGSVCKESKKLCPANKCNRMAEALKALFDAKLTVVTPQDVSNFAKDFEVCPHELSLCYSELCDVIICDFNYLFDPQVYIRRFFKEKGSYTFLVDEAHNLSDRAREMYSAEISLDDIRATELLCDLSPLKSASKEAGVLFKDTVLPYLRDEVRKDSDGILHGAYHSKDIPSPLYEIFDKLTAVAEDELYAAFGAKDDEKDLRIRYIRDYLYRVKRFKDAIDRFDGSFEFFAFLDGENLRIKLFCLDTGNVIRERLELGHSALIFSGTLSPIEYYRSVLGGDRSSGTLALDSPFAKEQLSVSIMNNITTRYSEREDSLLAICRVIAATLSARRGNYMIFSPSFQYSEALCEAFRKKYPKIDIILQKPSMTAKERTEFLDKFSKNDNTYLAAFCVMGGIYSEGIDLAGDKLIGAIIVGIGMPQISFEREAIMEYYQEKLEAGAEYAYFYPGMNRVLQAAGRVIRTEEDRGVIVLVDDRFNDPLYKKIMPSLWSGAQYISDARELKDRLTEFWLDVDSET